MEQYKIYDMQTKQEVNEADIIPGRLYILLEGKWEIKVAIFDENRQIKEKRYMDIKDKIMDAEILLENILENKGYKNIEVRHEESTIVTDGLQLNIPSYHVSYRDSQGRKMDRTLDEDNFSDIIDRTNEKDIQININGKTFNGNRAIIEKQGSSFKHQKLDFNMKDNNSGGDRNIFQGFGSLSGSNICLNIDQFGFKASYDFGKKEDCLRFQEDLPNIPRSAQVEKTEEFEKSKG